VRQDSEGRHLEHELVDLITAGIGLIVLAKSEDRSADDDEDQPPEPADEVRQIDHDPGEEGKLATEALKEGGEDRDHLPQNDVDDDDRDGYDRDRVDHRRFDLAFEPDGLLDVCCETLENGVEDTAGLARGNHVDVEVVKGLRVLAHGFGE